MMLFLVFFVIAVLFRQIRSELGTEGGEPLKIKLFRYSFIPHLCLFLFGIGLQRLKAHSHWLIRGKGHWWLLAYIAYSYLIPNNVWLQQLQLVFLGVTAISCAYTVPQLSRSLLGRTDISYGVYIYHCVILNVFIQLQWIEEWHYAALAIVISCLAGYLSWIFVERPCIRRKSHTLRQPLAVNTVQKRYSQSSV